MMWVQSPLLRVLRQPRAVLAFGPQEWSLLARQASAADLLGRVSRLIRAEPELAQAVPEPVARQLNGADSVVERQHKAVQWEARQIAQALEPTGVPVLLLKGAAYAMSGAPASAGRTFSDIDILVPKAEISEVESQLNLNGWLSASRDPYDQRYYRQWMHELPPLQHMKRGTTLDVHHAILPETARIRSRPEPLLTAKRALAGFANLYVPAPVDLILHSACHLFHEGEWAHGLRDLSDLDLLLRAFGDSEQAGEVLHARAEELNLSVPLAYATRCCAQVFGTPLPVGLAARLHGRPWMDGMFLRAMGTVHRSLSAPGAHLSRRLLYIRSHWLRMPLHLLVPHLLHQALARPKDVE